MTPEERNKLINQIREEHKGEPLEDWYTLIEEVQNLGDSEGLSRETP